MARLFTSVHELESSVSHFTSDLLGVLLKDTTVQLLAGYVCTLVSGHVDVLEQVSPDDHCVPVRDLVPTSESQTDR